MKGGGREGEGGRKRETGPSGEGGREGRLAITWSRELLRELD